MSHQDDLGSAPGTERRRSRSGVPGADAPPGAPGGSGNDGQSEIPDDTTEPQSGTESQGNDAEPEAESPLRLKARAPGTKGRRLRKPQSDRREAFTPESRLLLLDTWKRSGLPASDFSLISGVSAPTLYAWRRRFDEQGPEGLLDRQRGVPRGSRLPEVTKRTILMLKESHPDWGCQRISDMLLRGPALPASPGAVSKVLHEAGYELEEDSTPPHDQKPKRFERARPNQLWQTDLFSFTLKRQNRRVYLVGFLDDHSRFVLGYGLHATQSAALVLETLRAAITNYRTPEEILTDNGSQYVTWRGKSAFAKEIERQGIRHVVATPRHPQTLGKIERFWGTLWRECVESAIFLDLEDARRRIGLFIDHYNFQRPHRGIEGMVPADRYFDAAPEVLRTLKERVAANALELARGGLPRTPFYITGSAGGQPFSVHAEGERVILRRAEGERQEVELTTPSQIEAELPQAIAAHGSPPDTFQEPELPPGRSALDEPFGLLEDDGKGRDLHQTDGECEK